MSQELSRNEGVHSGGQGAVRPREIIGCVPVILSGLTWHFEMARAEFSIFPVILSLATSCK